MEKSKWMVTILRGVSSGSNIVYCEASTPADAIAYTLWTKVMCWEMKPSFEIEELERFPNGVKYGKIDNSKLSGGWEVHYKECETLPARKVTMKEVCEKFGEDVVIEKEDSDNE